MSNELFSSCLAFLNIDIRRAFLCLIDLVRVYAGVDRAAFRFGGLVGVQRVDFCTSRAIQRDAKGIQQSCFAATFAPKDENTNFFRWNHNR